MKKMKAIEAKDLIRDMSLLALSEENLIKYGQETLFDRAIPEKIDGLKPVHRRILWAASEMGLLPDRPYKKAARLCGDVMGKFHPHGSSAIYDAMVGMANLPTKLVDGQGNWGSWTDDPAAADRYTEARLSKFAHKFMLDRDYLAVVPMVPNYDETEKEPIYLPSLIPNLLLNGSLMGIAVGAVARHPSFTAESVIKLTQSALKNNKVSSKTCLNILEFTTNYGGKVISSDEEKLTLFSNNKGRIVYGPTFDADYNTKKMTITGLPPFLSIEKTIDKLYDQVTDLVEVEDLSEMEIKYVVSFKPRIERKDFQNAVKQCAELMHTKVHYMTSVTRRRSETDVDFRQWSIPVILMDWIKWRVEIEVACQKFKLLKYELQLKQNELLRKAVDHLDIIFKVLKQKNVDINKELSVKMKISLEEAKYILDLAVRRLSNLSAVEIDNKIKEIKKLIIITKNWIKNPKDKVELDLKEALIFFKEN